MSELSFRITLFRMVIFLVTIALLIILINNDLLQQYTTHPILEQQCSINTSKNLFHLPSVIIEPISSYVYEEKGPVTVLFVVHSALSHGDYRNVIRKYIPLADPLWSIIFPLGMSYNQTVNEEIDKEAAFYGDILRGDFLDTYRNLTYKHLMALHWASTNYPNVEIIVKMDDDIFLNLYMLSQFIEKMRNSLHHSNLNSRRLMCYVFKNSTVIRHPFSKWYVNKQELERSIYPNYCSGWAYLISMAAVKVLLCQMSRVPFFWIDDVYVTGLLREHTHVHMTNLAYTFNYNYANLNKWLKHKGRITFPYLFSDTSDNETNLEASYRYNYYYHLKPVTGKKFINQTLERNK